ncbi:hypothetical protein N7G274_000590 [Stereocaulon virgatum]|uniref:Homeobox domain-containing protein n=1 Tax=Stereocaulon virgatum TaxID=373712 RepID=A0ABR4AU57_9LECA
MHAFFLDTTYHQFLKAFYTRWRLVLLCWICIAPNPGAISPEPLNLPPGTIDGGARHLGNDSGMNSQTQRGYQHGASRGSASGRTHSSQEPGTRGKSSHGTHLLSPTSASGSPWKTSAGTSHRPSASPSPSSQYTPDLVLTKAEQESEEEEELDSTPSEEDDTMEGTEKTGAELLAEKRKMKRFRLTHAQTRYLMSEFARQSHPDSGQRERLSRDIPGLSPRQVQVWFQNRRAKLKRLTTDDQERMMRSRALPESFDFAHTLQSGVRDNRSQVDPVTSLANLNLRESKMRQDSTLGLGLDHPNLQANSMVSTYSNFPSGVGSAFGSGNLSPASSINEESHYSGSPFSETQSPVAANYYPHPLGRSSSLSVDPQSQRHQAELSRQRSASLAQSTPGFARSTSAYREYGVSDAPRAGPHPHNATQHAATFPYVRTPPPTTSPLTTPNVLHYDQRHTIYPQGAAAHGYYQASLSQSFGLSGSQSGQMVPENRRYNPSISRPSNLAQPPTSQPGSGPYVYDQSATYQSPVYEELDQQHISPPFGGPPAPGPATSRDPNAFRQRGSAFPNYYTHPR